MYSLIEHLQTFLYYIGIGLMWVVFLEYLTSVQSHHPDTPAWTNGERVLQIFLWPIFVLVFIKNLLNL